MRWKGYDLDANTWMPYNCLGNCKNKEENMIDFGKDPEVLAASIKFID